MLYSKWDNRRAQGDLRLVSLFDDQGSVVLDAPQSWPREEFEIDVEGHTWKITATDTTLTAVLPDAKVYVAEAGEKKFSRAKRIELMLNSPVVAENEQKNDWVYVDENDNKLGQFSGGNNGVRTSITEFEAVNELTFNEQVFMSLVTKRVLESRMNSSTLVLTISLLILTPIIILFAL